MHEKVKLKDIDPNLYRNMDHYKIDEKKVKRLIQSYDTVGYWPVIIGRRVGKRVQLAFGHHRWIALLKFYKDHNHEVEIIIMDLSDEDMLKMMANENQQDFASSFIVEMETIQAVVRAFANGEIELNAPEMKSGRGLRRAPEFRQVSSRDVSREEKLYNAMTVAEFLGWTDGDASAAKGRRAQPRVEDSVSALQFIEEGYLKLSQLEDLNRADCERVIHETHKERKERLDVLKESETYLEKIEADLEKVEGTPQEKEVKQRVRLAKTSVSVAKEKAKTEPAKAAKAVIDHAGEKKRNREAAEAAKAATNRPPKTLPDISQAADNLRAQLERLLTANDELGNKLEELSRHREQIIDGSRRLLISALERVVKRAQGFADKFKAPAEPRLTTREPRRLLAK